MALPNVELYNIAFEMNKMARHWGIGGSQPGWVKIEEGLVCASGMVEYVTENSGRGG